MGRYRHRPLHLFGGVGLIASVAGAAILGYLTVDKIGGAGIGGRPLLLLGVLLVVVGIQFLSLGLIGEMLTSQHEEKVQASGVGHGARSRRAALSRPRGRDSQLSDTALSREEAPRAGEQRSPRLRARMRVDAGEAAVALRVVYAGAAAYAALFVVRRRHALRRLQDAARFDLGNMVQAIWNTLHGHFLETTTLRRAPGEPARLPRRPVPARCSPRSSGSGRARCSCRSCRRSRSRAERCRSSGSRASIWAPRVQARISRSPTCSIRRRSSTRSRSRTASTPFRSRSRSCCMRSGSSTRTGSLRSRPSRLLACTTKEEIPLAVGCLGIWYAVRKGHRLFGLGVFAVGLAVTLFNFLWVIPALLARPVPIRSSAATAPSAGRRRGSRTSSSPIRWRSCMRSRAGTRPLYLALLLVPFLGLWLLEPLLFLGAVPDLAINLLSSKRDQTSIALPVHGGHRPVRRRGEHLRRRALQASRGRPLAVGARRHCGASRSSARSTSSAATCGRSARRWWPRRRMRSSLIPDGVPVSASNQLGGHLSERRYIYTFPYGPAVALDHRGHQRPRPTSTPRRLQARDPEVRGGQGLADRLLLPRRRRAAQALDCTERGGS